MIRRKFACVKGCSDCCTYREYYPSEEFGKIGVLLLPSEVPAIQEEARKRRLEVRILPRIAVGRDSPEEVIAYQLMGKNLDGDLCPFLDTESGARSPHGGLACSIYSSRPLACRAFPLEDDSGRASLDEHCRFCRDHSTTTALASTLAAESAALRSIREQMRPPGKSLRVWRYATATGRAEDKDKMLPEGWVMEG